MKETFTLTDSDREILKSYGLETDRLVGCSIRSYEFGERIVSQGLFNEQISIVTAGRASVGISAPNGKSLVICFYISEGLIGEAEYFTGSQIDGNTVTVLENMRCIAFPIRENRAYLDANLAFTRAAAAALSDKLLRQANGVIRCMLYPAPARLCRYILNAADGDLFRDAIPDIICSVGASYRHLYRMMHELCAAGVLEKTRGGYRILDRADLQTLSMQS